MFAEWDNLAATRFEQITSGTDLTFNHVLAPCLVGLARNFSAKVIIDAGCGIGALSALLRNEKSDIIGIDPSPASVAIARQHFGDTASFFTDTLEGFAEQNPACCDLIVSNMVVMDVPDLKAFVAGAARVLSEGGHFIVSLGHPCFWHDYAGFGAEPWFRYSQEQMVESPFRISKGEQPEINYTHVHRPLSHYAEALATAGFVITKLTEPLPEPQIEAQYPHPWKVPRFLVIVARKIA